MKGMTSTNFISDQRSHTPPKKRHIDHSTPMKFKQNKAKIKQRNAALECQMLRWSLPVVRSDQGDIQRTSGS